MRCKGSTNRSSSKSRPWSVRRRRGKRNILIYSNLSTLHLVKGSPSVNRIPPELLASIFALSPGTHSCGSLLPYWPFEEPHVNDLHKLPKVCRYWRELALATPTLWNSVVTVPHSQGTNYCFGRSVYLLDDSSVDLTVHYNPRRPSKHSVAKMTDFMLMNAPRIRELHTWDSSPIEDMQLFLRSFDANALEHCTIWLTRRLKAPRDTSPEPGRLLFFSNGGARLRSLCLADLRVLPENEFPALTLLKIGFVKRRDVSPIWGVEDLIKFLAGSPKLEEFPVSSTTVSLPRLQYFAFMYYLEIVSNDDGSDATNTIDFLLSCISFPPTCHLHLVAPPVSKKRDTNVLTAIPLSVYRRVPGKDAVSHMYLRLSDISSPMLLVFRQSGSLRLQIPPPGVRGNFHPHQGLFRTFPHLFATADELRIYYANDRLMTALPSLFPVPASTVFPNLAAISVIGHTNTWWSSETKPTLSAGLAHLVPPLPSTSATAGVDSVIDIHYPYPTLDTLWTSLESSEEIADLNTTLAARASFAFPIRRLVVSVRYPLPPDSDELAPLRALEGIEEVVMMELGRMVSGELKESDWLATLPGRHTLPSSVHRDWSAVWGRWQK